MHEDDFPWLWAAYRMGAFREAIEDGLTKEEFTERFLQLMEYLDDERVLHAPNDNAPTDEPVPVGLVVIHGKGKVIEPHVEWLPWATKRNKLETMLAFLREIGKTRKVFAFVSPDARPFYLQMCRYGVLTSGCKILDYFGKGKHVYFFYTRGPE